MLRGLLTQRGPKTGKVRGQLSESHNDGKSYIRPTRTKSTKQNGRLSITLFPHTCVQNMASSSSSHTNLGNVLWKCIFPYLKWAQYCLCNKVRNNIYKAPWTIHSATYISTENVVTGVLVGQLQLLSLLLMLLPLAQPCFHYNNHDFNCSNLPIIPIHLHRTVEVHFSLSHMWAHICILNST